MQVEITTVVTLGEDGQVIASKTTWRMLGQDNSLGTAAQQLLARVARSGPPGGEQITTGPQLRGGASEINACRAYADKLGLSRQHLDDGLGKHNAARVLEVLRWMLAKSPRNPAALFWSVLGRQ